MYYENQVAVSQDENGIITVTSDNTINPCQIGTYAEVHLMCDATASATEQVAVGCTLYTDGNPQDPLQIISSHSEGDMPDYSKYTKLAYLEHSGGCNLDTWVSFNPSGNAYQTFEECN
jgi:hypothetical protein